MKIKHEKRVEAVIRKKARRKKKKEAGFLRRGFPASVMRLTGPVVVLVGLSTY